MWCAAAVVALLAPAAAHAAPPAPGCLGMNFQAGAGDARETGSGLDVTGGFITFRDTTAVVNVTFADLDLAAYPQPDDLYKTVRVFFTVGSATYHVQATYNRAGSHGYAWGRKGQSASQRNRGAAHVGEGGVVEMDLPHVAPGATVTIGEVRTESYKAGGVEFGPDENVTRRTIDLTEGTKQTLTCPAAPAPPAPKQEPPSQEQQQPAVVAPAPAQPAPAAARTVILRARRLKGGRIRLSGRAAGVPDGARVVIARGSRVVARAVVRAGRFTVVTRRAVGRRAGLRARVAGRTSALVRVR